MVPSKQERMSSRNAILNALSAIPLPQVPLPLAKQAWYEDPANPCDLFMETVLLIGGAPVLVDDMEAVNQHLEALQEKGLPVVNSIPGTGNYNVAAYSSHSPRELETVNTFFLKGILGVAENGAIWVTDRELTNRIFPFIAHNLVIVLSEKDIVTNMHRAYERIQIDADGYGVFIAGPSKTADIEQSLVIGAHGPLSLQVFIIRDQKKKV